MWEERPKYKEIEKKTEMRDKGEVKTEKRGQEKKDQKLTS